MPLLRQWVRQRPWLFAGLAGAVSGIAGMFTGMNGLAHGGARTELIANEHPLRRRILRTLEHNPGLCYRELQKELKAANGTLRHHLDVLQNNRSLTVTSVNGRTCYFAGEPTQIEMLRGMEVSNEQAARMMPIGLSLVQRMIIEDIRKEGVPASQAELSRRLGRSRATTHSAVKVLRRRGILRQDVLDLAPHLDDFVIWHPDTEPDYEWDDERL